MPDLSVVVPVFNERDNIPLLLAEIAAALRSHVDYEVVYVDDASRDDSLDVLKAARLQHPELRIVRHLKQSGQSTAIRTGVQAARGAWIATLDGDGQNDPADIPKLIAARPTPAPTSSSSPAGAPPAATASTSAFHPRSPTPCARECCATPRPTPAAA